MSKKWVVLPKISKTLDKKFKKYPSVVRQLLYNRGIKKAKDAKEYLDPEQTEFYDSKKIYDVRKASKLILDAIKKKKKIIIHGDFDVDGICAVSILWDFLYRKLKADVLPYVPSRFDEGYGITEKSLKNIEKLGGDLVITVDCGIRDAELIEKWSKKGMEFIVTDHHELKKVKRKNILPKEALAVVHPQHPKSTYPFVEIAGTTVVWKLVSVLAENAKNDSNVNEYLDLVALATVCDVMPLVDENRSIVKKGLKKIQKTKRIGLRRLIYDSGLEPESIEAYHLGFIIGPRLNAAGRLDHAIDAIRLLVTNSPTKARDISHKLNRLNQDRQNIQRKIYDSALEQIQEIGISRKLYFVWGDDWEEGVIGIVAGKISEKYNRPVIIATKKGDFYTGSARSTSSFNIIQNINTQADLLEKFGGHAQAAGFTVSPGFIEQFRENLLEIADRDLQDSEIVNEESVDCEIRLSDIDTALLGWINLFAPFGSGNQKPKFVIRTLEIADLRLVGQSKNHLSLSFLKRESGEYIGAIGFDLVDENKDLNSRDIIDVLFTLEWNEWNGEKKIQMIIKDIRKKEN